jgi:hypothetical protein
MTKDEALRLALEALESTGENNGYHGLTQYFDEAMVDQAITTIKECLDKKWSDYPCYKWPGYITGMGYGQLGTKKKLGKNISAHRLVWEATNGPIPHGLSLDHLCRNPACVNPHHLEPVTHKENCLRGVGITAINSKKTHCKTGHPFDEENTGYQKSGKRYCKECQKAASNKYRMKKNGQNRIS